MLIVKICQSHASGGDTRNSNIVENDTYAKENNCLISKSITRLYLHFLKTWKKPVSHLIAGVD